MARKSNKGAKAGDAPQHDGAPKPAKPAAEPADSPTLDPDTCMMIVDPATKVKMPLLFSQTEPTNGRVAYIKNLGTKKDSYLCMLYQRGRCKSHGNCNQIHADKKLVAKAREEHAKENGESIADEPLSNQRGVEVVVVDPTNKQSRVSVPLLQTKVTVGRAAFLKAMKDDGVCIDVEVCPLYVNAVATAPVPPTPNANTIPPPKCRAGEQCPHIHIDLALLKFLLEPGKPCCQFHGTEHTVDFKGKVFMINKANQRCPLPLNRLMTTKGLRELITSQSSLAFACNRVCRLHQEKRCQWGRECSNLHVCREFYSVYSSTNQPSRTSMPSYRGLQILANGKLKPIMGRKGAPQNGTKGKGIDIPAAMAALPPPHLTATLPGFGMPPNMPPHMPPFMHPGMGREAESVMGSVVGIGETYGIPLVTDEGPVQKRLLPDDVRKKIPDIPALATPVGSVVSGKGAGRRSGNNSPQPAQPVNGTLNPPHPMARIEVPAGLQDVDEVGSEPCTPPLSPQQQPMHAGPGRQGSVPSSGYGAGYLHHTSSLKMQNSNLGPTYSAGPPQLGTFSASALHATSSSGSGIPPPLYTPAQSGTHMGGEPSAAMHAFAAGPTPPFPMNGHYPPNSNPNLPHTWSEVGRKHTAGRPGGYAAQPVAEVLGAPTGDPHELSQPAPSFTNDPYSLHSNMTPTTSAVRAAC